MHCSLLKVQPLTPNVGRPRRVPWRSNSSRAIAAARPRSSPRRDAGYLLGPIADIEAQADALLVAEVRLDRVIEPAREEQHPARQRRIAHRLKRPRREL